MASASGCISAYRSAVADDDFIFKIMLALAELAAAVSGPVAEVVFAGEIVFTALQHESCMKISLNNLFNSNENYNNKKILVL